MADDITKMSPDDIQRELAERVGYRAKRYTLKSGRPGWKILKPNGGIVQEDFIDTGDEIPWWRYCPDYHGQWVDNAGAALALCLEIGAPRRWHVLNFTHHTTAHGATFVTFESKDIWREVWVGDKLMKANFQKSAALALSTLALRALREGKQ